MEKDSRELVGLPVGKPDDVLSEVLRQGAKRLLAQAIEVEVEQWLEDRKEIVDAGGRRQVVRNGYQPERSVLTSIGPVDVKRPRIRDRRPEGEREAFASKILPPYLRKSKSVEELIPWLYLRGISTGDFTGALEAIIGPDAPGLSASTVVRLKKVWEEEYRRWSRRSLEGKRYVYIWADGIFFNIRLEEDRQCILVLMGATEDGRKELLAVADGFRESEQSWKALLLDLKSRGLKFAPKLAVGDGALGFWAALRKVYPATCEQRCWVHKTANVLDKLPKRLRTQAKGMLHEIWMAPTKDDANRAFDLFVETYQAKYPKATGCLEKDRDALMTFYDFPAEHWIHLRTTNPIESTFATLRLRTKRTKGSGSRTACLSMVFKLVMLASKRWRALNGAKAIVEVSEGIQFKDGIKIKGAAA
jgi:putative transposase